MGSPKKWLRGDIHTMGVKMAKNWVAPLIDSPLWDLEISNSDFSKERNKVHLSLNFPLRERYIVVQMLESN